MSRSFWAGALTPIALFLLIAGGTAIYWPDIPALGILARSLESLAPQLLVLALAVALVVWALGARSLAVIFAGISLAAGGALVARHLSHAAPMGDGPADLKVLWFNVLSFNEEPADRIAAALKESGADLLLLSESEPLDGHFDELQALFPYRAGCRGDCAVTILSRYPLEVLSFGRMRHWRPGRLVVVKLEPPGAEPVTVIATHQVKPWYYGTSEEDSWYLQDELRRNSGPLVVAGDLNAAPWSQRLQELYAEHDLVPPRVPIATWPAAAGAFGVPIDHIMTRGAAAIVSIEPWGGDLGSNHRGLLAGIALKQAGDR